MATAEAPVSTDTAVAPVAPVEPVIPAKGTRRTPGRYVELSIKDIVTKAGDNIRTGELPEIEKLAASIAVEGVIEPILVTPSLETPGKFTVIAGHRRLTAVRSLEDMLTIPALIVDADANRRISLALTENIQREGMAPLDVARGLAKLIESTKLEQQEVAQVIGVAPGFVSQYLALLALPESALNALRDGEISFTHARTLCRLGTNTKAIDDLMFEISNLTAAALDAKVSYILAQTRKAAAEAEAAAPEADGDAEDKPKRAKKVKAVPSEKEIVYYTEAEFRPMKKEDMRDLMVTWKRKEVNADSPDKQLEYKNILRGIALAANLRFK